MKLETFFKKFDQFADMPNAVEKMRELVLELAIQGKLVAQASDEEPARKQLERIAAKKSKTRRVARVKAGTGGSSAPEDTETHVPDGWEKTSLAALVTVLNGRAYSKDELLAAGTPVLRVGNLFTSNHWYYSDLELEPDKYCDKGDLIFAWSASFGPFIWPGPKVIYHYHIWKLELHSKADLHNGYLYWFLQNKTQEIKRAGHGVSMLHMTKEKMEKLEVMLPPLAEQKRIVAKVDELMAMCDHLEAQQQERETRHAVLARASLARFADAPTPGNLDFLFHKSYDITPADIRKSILTLAVEGKLVPQDPDDEPAEELFKKIQKDDVDRSSLLKRNSSIVEPAEFHHDIPEHWVWCELQEISDFINGKAHEQFVTDEPGFALVNSRFVSNSGRIFKYSTQQLTPLFRGDIALVMSDVPDGRALARCFVVDEDDKYTLNQRIGCIRTSDLLCKAYLAMVLDRNAYFLQCDDGKKQTNLKKIQIVSCPVPLPPLAEQRRIVAKVNQLMGLVDELETQLAASRGTAEKLMDAVVAEIIRA